MFERLVAFLVFLLLLLGAAALTRGNDLGIGLAPSAPEVACAACAPPALPSAEDEGDDDKDEDRKKDDDREKDEERRDKDPKGKGKGKR